MSGEFQEETNKYNKALHDSLQHYLAIYNKDKKYGMIFAKQGDNVLYADKAYDITNEVVAGLNKAYKSKLKDFHIAQNLDREPLWLLFSTKCSKQIYPKNI